MIACRFHHTSSRICQFLKQLLCFFIPGAFDDSTSRLLSMVLSAETIVGDPFKPTDSADTPRSSIPHWVISFFLALMIPEGFIARGEFSLRVTVRTAGRFTRTNRYPSSKSAFTFQQSPSDSTISLDHGDDGRPKKGRDLGSDPLGAAVTAGHPAKDQIEGAVLLDSLGQSKRRGEGVGAAKGAIAQQDSPIGPQGQAFLDDIGGLGRAHADYRDVCFGPVL